MFITLEGIEGAGKTSQVKNIVAFLEGRGYECVTTREPGGTAIGAQIRRILLDPQNSAMDPGTELLLYTADRVQHVRSFIAPHLAAGRVVLCDRFFDATLVYQGYARGLDRRLIRTLHRMVCGDLQPDLTLLFDLPPEVGLARAWRQIDSGGRAGRETRFEHEQLAFHRKVRDGYLQLAQEQLARFRILDAGQDPQTVARAVEKALACFLDEEKARDKMQDTPGADHS
jgi:dTMP kinase